MREKPPRLGKIPTEKAENYGIPLQKQGGFGIMKTTDLSVLWQAPSYSDV
jgi:hypothetical protein